MLLIWGAENILQIIFCKYNYLPYLLDDFLISKMETQNGGTVSCHSIPIACSTVANRSGFNSGWHGDHPQIVMV